MTLLKCSIVPGEEIFIKGNLMGFLPDGFMVINLLHKPRKRLKHLYFKKKGKVVSKRKLIEDLNASTQKRISNLRDLEKAILEMGKITWTRNFKSLTEPNSYHFANKLIEKRHEEKRIKLYGPVVMPKIIGKQIIKNGITTTLLFPDFQHNGPLGEQKMDPLGENTNNGFSTPDLVKRNNISIENFDQSKIKLVDVKALKKPEDDKFSVAHYQWKVIKNGNISDNDAMTQKPSKNASKISANSLPDISNILEEMKTKLPFIIKKKTPGVSLINNQLIKQKKIQSKLPLVLKKVSTKLQSFLASKDFKHYKVYSIGSSFSTDQAPIKNPPSAVSTTNSNETIQSKQVDQCSIIKPVSTVQPVNSSGNSNNFIQPANENSSNQFVDLNELNHMQTNITKNSLKNSVFSESTIQPVNSSVRPTNYPIIQSVSLLPDDHFCNPIPAIHNNSQLTQPVSNENQILTSINLDHTYTKVIDLEEIPDMPITILNDDHTPMVDQMAMPPLSFNAAESVIKNNFRIVDVGLEGPTIPNVPQAKENPSTKTLSDSSVQTQGVTTEEKKCQTDIKENSRNDLTPFIIKEDVNMGSGPQLERFDQNNLHKLKIAFFNSYKTCLDYDSGNLPIHNAVMQNNLKLTRQQCTVLKARKAGINLVNDYGYTALHLSIIYGCDDEIINLLLDYGADLSAEDPNGNNILHLCVEYDKPELLKVFIENIHESGYNGLLDIDALNNDGFSPLMIAASNNHLKSCEILVTNGASPNKMDSKAGRTALYMATENHNDIIVQFLLLNEADTRIRNFVGTSIRESVYEMDDAPPSIKSLILGRYPHDSKKKNDQDGKNGKQQGLKKSRMKR